MKQKSKNQDFLYVVRDDLFRIERKCNSILREVLRLNECIEKLPCDIGRLIDSLNCSSRQLRNQCRQERIKLEKSYLQKRRKYDF